MAGKYVRVLVMASEGVFVAQGLEHDICVQAPDLDTLQRRFERACRAEAAIHDNGLDDIAPAPPEFHEKWDAARALGGAPENTEMRLAA